jgi:hypothetical protein
VVNLSRHLSLICALAIVLSVAPAAQATSAAQLPRGFYDCYSWDAAAGNTIYRGSLQVVNSSRYSWGPNRKGRTIVSGRSGSYSTPGQQINFSGVLGDLYGIVKPGKRIVMFAKGEKYAAWTCYYKFA